MRSAGIEPTLSAPEANVLSTGLRARINMYLAQNINNVKFYKGSNYRAPNVM